MTPHLDAVALLPEIAITITLVLVFIADLFIGDRQKYLVGFVAFLGTALALGCVVGLAAADRQSEMLQGAYIVDNFALLAKGLFIASTAVVLLLGMPRAWKGEYFTLILSSLLGMILIASARELLIFFVSFELLAVPGYMLSGWNKKSKFGHEAALKYYLLGVVASAIMLYGISLLFGIAGSTLFTDVAAGFASGGGSDIALGRIAVLFVIVGVAFKISAVPFHFWAPDAYQGAPIPVAAFLSVASKAAGMIALIELIVVAFPNAGVVWAPLLWGLAAVTMTVGNLIALRQVDVVRMLAYSSIAQAGYMLVPLATMGRYGGDVPSSVAAVFEFLIIYAAMNLGAFAVAAAVLRRTGRTTIASYKALFNEAPSLAIFMTIFLFSLAGIPPLGGWFAKLVIFRAAIDAGGPTAVVLAIVAAVNTAIGLGYYSVVVRNMWLQPGGELGDEDVMVERRNTASQLTFALGLTAAAVIVAGVLPGLVTHLGEFSSFAP